MQGTLPTREVVWRGTGLCIDVSGKLSFCSVTTYRHGWPRACASWSWNRPGNFLQSRQYTLHDVLVDGCVLGMRGRDGELIYKKWDVITIHELVARSLSVLRCPGGHARSSNFDLRGTHNYPEGMVMVKTFLRASFKVYPRCCNP